MAPGSGSDMQGICPQGFVLVQAGRFIMGTAASAFGASVFELPHDVSIAKPFCIQATEVNQRDWRTLMAEQALTSPECGLDCPAQSVSWFDATEYANRKSRAEGLEPCYRGGDAVGASCRGYRLPTEAEWEYAALAGGGLRRGLNLGAVAWYDGNAQGRVHRVGMKAPNPWGLSDMLGNVWEWTGDWFAPYETTLVSDPQGPVSGSARVLRGGAWSASADCARVSYRFSAQPSAADESFGFRLVLPVH
jgi:formylglycine-generating enzyme required for sulfatase activity